MNKRTVKPSEERRNELLDIGIQIFMEEGSEKISVKKVVDQANVATGLFYYYFPSKEAFIDEALKRYIENYVEELSSSLQNKSIGVLERIENTLRIFWKQKQSIEPHANETALHSHEQISSYLISVLLPVIEDVIQEGCNQTLFNVPDIKMSAIAITYMFYGVIHEPISENSKSVESLLTLLHRTLGIKENTNE